MSRNVVFAPLAVVVLSMIPAAPSPVWAAVTAPLPNGTAPSGQPTVRGLYAESSIGNPELDAELDALNTACAGRGMELRVDGGALAGQGRMRVYRSDESVAVYREVPKMTSDPDTCTVTIRLSRSGTAESGSWSRIRPDGLWSAETPKCRRGPGYRCLRQTVSGIAARCIVSSNGFQGVTLCYSTRRDLSKDMMISRSSFSDDGSENADWSYSVINVRADIDPVVFAATR